MFSSTTNVMQNSTLTAEVDLADLRFTDFFDSANPVEVSPMKSLCGQFGS